MMKIASLVSATLVALAGCSAPTEAELSRNAMQCVRSAGPIAGENAPINEPIDQKRFAKVFLRDTNFERCKYGLPPLKDAPEFNSIALVHSDWMAATDTLSHESNKPGWHHLGDRLDKINIPIRKGSENIGAIFHPAAGHNELFFTRPKGSCNLFRKDGSRIGPHTYASLSKYTVQQLMDSPGHRRNILDSDMTHHTAATRIERQNTPCGRHYITQNFVQKAHQ